MSGVSLVATVYIYISPFPRLLKIIISLTVSVDVKHHVFLLTYFLKWVGYWIFICYLFERVWLSCWTGCRCRDFQYRRATPLWLCMWGVSKQTQSTETIRLIGDGANGGGGGEGRGRLYTLSRYTVTTGMTAASRWAAMKAILMSFTFLIIVRDKITRPCPQTTTFEEKGEPKQIRTEVPLLHQLNALPLGQTGSLMLG